MSELSNAYRNSIRRVLLATTCAAALLTSAYLPERALAADDDKPLVWIEVGGQLQRLDDTQERLNPSFLGSIANPALSSPLNVQASPLYAVSEQAAISFQPADSDWVLSASVQYGRSQDAHHLHHQTANARVPVSISIPPPFTAFKNLGKYYSFYPNGHVKLSNGSNSEREQHVVLDFQAGKDVGLGTFGHGASSVISGGVRIAQFQSRTNTDLRVEPDVQYPTAPIIGSIFAEYGPFHAFKSAHVTFHDFHATLDSQRSFRGIGPSVAWNASVPFAGNAENGDITFDWGANAAVLFGRQKVRGQHKTEDHAYYGTHWYAIRATANLEPGRFVDPARHYGHINTEYAHAAPITRTRSVTVPNLGGFAGLSFRYSDAKVSFGYRADFFWGAMDGGLDTAKSENRGFYGPFATVSVGIGG